MPAFGSYVTPSAPSVEPGMYNAIIDSVRMVRSADGSLELSENSKPKVDVYFRVDAENVLRRRYTVSFGQNKQNNQWSAFAKLIDAATGIKCGDKAQGEVDEDALSGNRVRIVVETNDRGYSDVTSVLPAGGKPTAAARPDPKPAPEPSYDDEGAWPESP